MEKKEYKNKFTERNKKERDSPDKREFEISILRIQGTRYRTGRTIWHEKKKKGN